MRNIILLVHTSLDGFVGGTKGELDGFDASEENLQFVCSLTEHADAALFGRTSFHLLDQYWPNAARRPNATEGEIAYSNWYNSAVKIVISKTMNAQGFKNTIVIHNTISKELTKIKNQTGKDILIFGSPSIAQELMRLDLIDSFWVFVNPSIFGKGIPLFAGEPKQIKLKLISTKQFSNGEIGLHYLTLK